VTAVSFWQVMLSIHIAAVVVGFGVTFAYPIINGYGRRLDPSHMAWWHRVQAELGKKLITPSLAVIFLVGIYLASHQHQWSYFYVQFGVVAALILGGLGGMFFAPREQRLAELAERDIAATAGGPVTFSPEYQTLFRRVSMASLASSLLVLVTVYLMSVQA